MCVPPSSSVPRSERMPPGVAGRRWRASRRSAQGLAHPRMRSAELAFHPRLLRPVDAEKLRTKPPRRPASISTHHAVELASQGSRVPSTRWTSSPPARGSRPTSSSWVGGGKLRHAPGAQVRHRCPAQSRPRRPPSGRRPAISATLAPLQTELSYRAMPMPRVSTLGSITGEPLAACARSRRRLQALARPAPRRVAGLVHRTAGRAVASKPSRAKAAPPSAAET